LAANRKTVAGGDPALRIHLDDSGASSGVGLLAEEVIEGETLPFDRKLLLAPRQAGNPGVPIGPPWLPEAARDISALCSTIVLGTLFLAMVGYSLLTRRPAAAWLMLGAVSIGVALNSLLGWCIGTAWAMGCWVPMTWLQRGGQVEPPEKS
jgi:hypothetical protein